MLITLNDLDKKPCENYMYLYEKYSMDTSFNPIEEIKNNINNREYDYMWLLANCKKDLPLKEIPISYVDFSYLIATVLKFQKIEHFQSYIDMKPDEEDIDWLLENCSLFKEWYEKQHSELVK